MKKEQLLKLLGTESEQLKKLNDIVIESVEEEKILSQKLFEYEDKNTTLAGRLADKVAAFGGSWKFILSFLLFMLIWIGINIYMATKPFDPYPFILLNLLLSTVAALQAPVILMSQNRKEEKDRQRATNDYLVNLKAEIEIRNLHQKIDLLITEQMKTMFEIQKVQVDLMQEIKAALNAGTKSKSI
ncbi:MAG: DUF1003 domain-containing protein [Ginsengibacter sp.]